MTASIHARGFFPRREDEDEIIRRHLNDFDEMCDILARIMNGAVKCSHPRCNGPVQVDFSTNPDVRQVMYREKHHLPGDVLVRKRCQDHINKQREINIRARQREKAHAATA